MDRKTQFANYKKQRAEMAALTREGYTIIALAAKYGISKQAVSQRLHRAASEGEEVHLTLRSSPHPNITYHTDVITYYCDVCKTPVNGKRMTCSEECAKKRRLLTAEAKNSKWTHAVRNKIIACKTCHRDFEVTNYMLARSEYYGTVNSYCCKECYHNRGRQGVNNNRPKRQ